MSSETSGPNAAFAHLAIQHITRLRKAWVYGHRLLIHVLRKAEKGELGKALPSSVHGPLVDERLSPGVWRLDGKPQHITVQPDLFEALYELTIKGNSTSIELLSGVLRISEQDLELYLASCRSELTAKPSVAPRIKLKHLRA